jgi:hypothetical protein
MKTETKARLWFLFACVLAVAWFVWGIQLTEASERRGNNDDVNVDVDNVVNVGGDTVNVGGSTLTGGDVSVPVNVSAPSTSTMHNEAKSLALGNVLGDVDIADCLGSHQWNTPIFGRQDLKLNQVCMAEFYLSAGKYQLAARALEQEVEQLRWEQSMLQAQISEQQALLEKAEARPQPKPVVVQQEFVTEEKRAAIKALFADDEGEDDE